MPNTIQAVLNRRAVRMPVTAPMIKLITMTPMTRAGLSLLPRVSIAHFSTDPGTLSITPVADRHDQGRNPRGESGEQFADAQCQARSDHPRHRRSRARNDRRAFGIRGADG